MICNAAIVAAVVLKTLLLLMMSSCVTETVLRLTATVDDKTTIYSEGVVVAMNSQYDQPTTVTIDDPCVLAIKGEQCVTYLSVCIQV